jgi:hypothetical protein
MYYDRDKLSNRQDTIDSLEIIRRFDELERDAEIDDESDSEDERLLSDDEREELEILRKVCEQGEGYGDWSHGTTMIRDSYFIRYAQEAHQDQLSRVEEWIKNAIDWQQAASDLQADYAAIDYDGVTYWIKA